MKNGSNLTTPAKAMAFEFLDRNHQATATLNDSIFYFAELGVLDGHRARGLGQELVRLRLDLIDTSRYHHVLLRTSASRNASYEMYLRLGFQDTGVYMEVKSRKNDNSQRTDRRLFLSRVVE